MAADLEAKPDADADHGDRSWDVAAALLLIVLVGLTFGRTLRFGFVYDDRWTLLDNPIIRAPANLWRLLGPDLARAGVPDAGRPVLLASEILDWALWRARPIGYHLQNLIWHSGVVVLLFAHLRRAGLPRFCALLPAALFAVHPLVVEPVAAINYREDLLSAFFVLLALWWSIPRAGVVRTALGAGALLLGALAKENAVVAPLLLLVMIVVPRADDGGSTLPARLRGARWQLVALWGAAAAAFLWRWWATGGAALVSVTAEIPAAHHDRAWAVPRSALAFLQGVGQFVWPQKLAPEYPDLPGGGVTTALGWLGVAAIVAVTIVAVRGRARRPQLSLGWLFAVVAYLPNFGLVPLTNLRADRYMYLPALGLAVAVAALLFAILAAIWRKSRPAVANPMPAPLLWLTGALLVLLMQARAIRQTPIWRDDLALFTAATAADPRSQRAWIGLATAQLRAGQRLAALESAEQAVALADAPRAREIRGLVWLAQGDATRARQDLAAALAGAAAGHRAQVLNNLGYAEIAAGDLASARQHLTLASQLAPRFDRPALQLARVALQAGDLVEARTLLVALLQRVPESLDGWRLLADVEDRAGQGDAARAAHARVQALGGAEKAKTPPGP
jgi:protein O-mannosyl-transferase